MRFACPTCHAEPRQVAGTAASIEVVEHPSTCETYQAQVRARWPLRPAGLPERPAPVAFEQRAAVPRWHRAVTRIAAKAK